MIDRKPLIARVIEPQPMSPDLVPNYIRDARVEEFIESFVKPVNPRLHEHLLQVGYYTYVMGAMSGLRRFELRQEYNGALLHDVGKVASKLINDISNTNGKITTDELVIMKYHPVLGDELVKGKGWEGYSSFVRWHHETYDPTMEGYPDGLSLENLPLGPQRVSIADWYSASRMQRPDQPSKSQLQAVASVEYQFALGRWNPVLLPQFRAMRMYAENVPTAGVYF